jgi:hypothetical protein
MSPSHAYASYEGRCTPGECDWRVTVDGAPLNPRLDLYNHSPSGLAWGYAGSGPAQLALAILAHYLHAIGAPNADALAMRHHQEFKARAIAPLPMDEPFTLTSADVAETFAACRRDFGDTP